MRHLVACLLIVSLAPSAAALETSLVLRPPGGTNSEIMAVINPAVGTIQLYRVGGEQLITQDYYSFSADLDLLRQQPHPENLDWVMLRTGSPTTLPTYAEVMARWLPAIDKANERNRDENTVPLAEKARNTEEDFWKQVPEYDGVVRGAMGQQGIVLVIPSLYTILFYRVVNWEVELAGWRNYRTDLYVPQVYESLPAPQDLFRRLPDDVKQDRREKLEEQAEKLGESAGKVIPVAASDPWIGSVLFGNQESFVMVDPPNKRIVVYQFRGRGGRSTLELQSVRNMDIDLMIPSTYNSEPDIRRAVINYNERLRRAKLAPVSTAYIRRLVQDKSVGGKGTSDMHATIDDLGNLFLDFPKRQKIFVYRILGRANKLELISARDYAIEVGIALHSHEIQQRNNGTKLFSLISKIATRRNVDRSLRLMELALDWNPFLYEQFEKDRGLARLLGEDERWQKLIESAIKRSEELKAAEEKRLEEIQAEMEER